MKESVVVPNWWRSLTPSHYGFEQCSGAQFFGPAVRDHYLIHFVLSGRGFYSVSGKSFELCEGDIFVIRPGEMTLYRADKDSPWSYAWIGFSANNGIDFLTQYTYHVPTLRSYFEKLKEFSHSGACDGEVYAVLYNFVSEMFKMFGPSSVSDADYASWARLIIETSYMRAISIQEIADSMHINRHYLCQLFRSKYGLSPKSFLTQTRMANAKHFLSQGYKATEVSTMVGISDASNFSRIFKNYYGFSPSHTSKMPGDV